MLFCSKSGLAVVLMLSLSACAGLPSQRASDGSLPDCGDASNCVSSTASNPDQFIAPLRYSGSREAAQRALAKIIGQMRGGAVMENETGYMRVEFESAVFGFVDDVQFLLMDDRTIQVRSTSRSTSLDLGVSRQRIERIRRDFDAIQP